MIQSHQIHVLKGRRNYHMYHMTTKKVIPLLRYYLMPCGFIRKLRYISMEGSGTHTELFLKIHSGSPGEDEDSF
jgi:hypothetical protein